MPGKFDGGTCRAQVISLLQTFFLDRFICLRAMFISLMTLTSTGWLMEASPQEMIPALKTFGISG